MMRVRRIVLSPFETNCWLVDDGEGGPVVIVDPGGNARQIVAAVKGTQVACVVLTHGHVDHLAAVRDVLEATGAPLLIHKDDASMSTSTSLNGGGMFGFGQTAPRADRLLEEGDVVAAGELRLDVLHTPGHTPGGICLFIEDASGGPAHLISGDTVFAGSVGRTDMPGGDMRTLMRSIARLAALPDETVVLPGHGPGTTIGRERLINPFFPRA